METTRMHTVVPASYKAALRRLAAQKGVTVGEVVRRALAIQYDLEPVVIEPGRHGQRRPVHGLIEMMDLGY